MKAAILYKPNTPLEVVQVEQQGPKAGEARVRVFENPDRPFLRALQAKLGWQGTERRSM